MSEKPILIYVGGVPKSGKSTLCTLITKQRTDMTYISSGELKAEEAKRRYKKSLSSLNQNESTAVNDWLIEEIMRTAEKKFEEEQKKVAYLIDSHYSHPLMERDSEGEEEYIGNFVRTTPEKHMDKINSWILVEAHPLLVLGRRL